MAAPNPLQNLQEEATCPICLDHLTDPVITPCGHNFCRRCIKGCSEGPGAPFCCPQCREPCSRADLRPNRQLQSMVELVKQLSVKAEAPPTGQDVCVQHEEKLKLFCQDDQKMICVICQVSREHERHTVRPINEAAQEYQGKLQNWLPSLTKQREVILVSKKNEEEQYVTMRKNLDEEKRKTMAGFKHLRQLLKEQEQLILTKLEEMKRKITMVENSNIAKLSNQISSLDSLIKEIATKCKQPPEELLKDVGLTLSKCENVKFCGPEPLKQSQRKDRKMLVTLDPETAHDSLDLSENQRRVTYRGAEHYEFGDPIWMQNAKRFTDSACVLGKEGFCSGRYYWEVESIWEGPGWTVGVARESVNRNLIAQSHQLMNSSEIVHLEFTESPQAGVWALHVENGQCVALTVPRTALPLHHPIKKLGVYLDYEAGQVSLYNAGTMELLYTFRGAALQEKVYPYFSLCSEGFRTSFAKYMLPVFTDLRLL